MTIGAGERGPVTTESSASSLMPFADVPQNIGLADSVAQPVAAAAD